MIKRPISCILVVGFFTLLSASGVTGTSPVPADSELIVFCDVSASLKLEVVKSEADAVFRLINNDVWFPHGKFAIYIADRDAERGFVFADEKNVFLHQDEKLKQVDRLNRRREELRRTLADYCTRRPALARSRTCLVKAIRIAPRLFKDPLSVANRRVLIVSDMLEDCFAEGDPTSKATLKARIARSVGEYPLSDLGGLRVYVAIVSSAANPLDIEDLRNIWDQTLEITHSQLTMGPLDELLPGRIASQ